MIKKVKRPLAVATTCLLVVAAILAAVYALGQYALGRMLSEDALMTARLWSQARLQGRQHGSGRAVAGADTETIAEALGIAHIDRLLLVSAEGDPIAVCAPAADGAADFTRVMASAIGPEIAPFSRGERRLHRSTASAGSASSPTAAGSSFRPKEPAARGSRSAWTRRTRRPSLPRPSPARWRSAAASPPSPSSPSWPASAIGSASSMPRTPPSASSLCTTS